LWITHQGKPNGHDADEEHQPHEPGDSV
jgi:hypothetical protein